MKVRIIEDGFIIIPETDFETEYIKQFQKKDPIAFVKTGSSLNQIMGLKIVKASKEKVNGN